MDWRVNHPSFLGERLTKYSINTDIVVPNAIITVLMNQYIPRRLKGNILALAEYFPVVAIVGPRQVGKTSLVQRLHGHLAKETVYLDMENPDDRIKLDQPTLFLEPLANKTVILDEIQRVPELFPVLRGIIDRNREPGRFIFLGSASPDLIRGTSESLAGRIAFIELTPFMIDELPETIDFRTHWLRGGFPDSLLAPDESMSSVWRENFIRTYLEQDLADLGLGAEPLLIRRLWQMLAHLSGQLLNKHALASSLGIHSTTVSRYLDLMESAFLIQRLPPFLVNTKKRLVKTPKMYLRDTGILHQLLRIPSFVDLSGHPIMGSSWETWVVNQITGMKPEGLDVSFYRTHDGTEVDLVLSRSTKPVTLVEIKYSTTPRVTRGFTVASADLNVERRFIVCPVEYVFPLSNGVRVLGFKELGQLWEGQ